VPAFFFNMGGLAVPGSCRHDDSRVWTKTGFTVPSERAQCVQTCATISSRGFILDFVPGSRVRDKISHSGARPVIERAGFEVFRQALVEPTLRCCLVNGSTKIE